MLKRQRGAKVIQTQGKLIRKTPDERWNLDVHFTLPDGSLITHMVSSLSTIDPLPLSFFEIHAPSEKDANDDVEYSQDVPVRPL